MKTKAFLKSALMISLVFTVVSCSKKDGGGDTQKFYKCNCSGKTLDWEFGGYDTYSNDSSSGVMATSYQDAKKKCDEKDFKAGEESRDCTAMP